MLTIQEQGEHFLTQMNAALASKEPTVQAVVSAKPDDKDSWGKRLQALVTTAVALSDTMQQVAMVGLGGLAIASAAMPGDLRVETEEIGADIERRFTFFRGDFRVGMVILGQQGKESGKVGGSVSVLIDEAALTYPQQPVFSAN